MIDMSEVLIAYFNNDYSLKAKKKSGTKIAFEYAQTNNKRVINLYECL